MMKILILCTGNSCRSQMAHGFLQAFDPQLEVRSAGTAPAEAVNPHAVKVMAEAGTDLSHHTPHSVEEYLGETWDYVITVCGGAREHCPPSTGRVGRRLHIGFDDPAGFVGTEAEVMEGFRRVRDEIRQRFHDLYEQELLTS